MSKDNEPKAYTNNLDSRCRIFQESVVNCNVVEEMYMADYDAEFYFKNENAKEGFWRTFNNKLCNVLSDALEEGIKINLGDYITDICVECVEEAVDLGIMVVSDSEETALKEFERWGKDTE